MITAFYVSLASIFIVWLSLNVIKTRRAEHISLGDGNNISMQIAIAAQANAVQYLPLTLLLMLTLELNGGFKWIIHLSGILLLAGRVMHAKGLLKNQMKLRVLGMQLTIFILLALAIINLLFLPYT